MTATLSTPAGGGRDPETNEPSAPAEAAQARTDRPFPVAAAANGERKRQRRQSVALVILAVLAGLVCVYVARAVLMPVLIAIILTLLLRPLIRRCRKYHIPDAVSAACVLTVLLMLLGIGVANLVGPAQDWVVNAPRHLQVVVEKLSVVRDQIQQITLASNQFRALAEGKDQDKAENESILDKTIRQWRQTNQGKQQLSDEAEEEQPVPVEVRQPRLEAGLSFLTVTGGFLAGVVITVVLTYFLLATGDQLLNNVLHVIPTFHDKRRVVELVYEVERGVSSYLLTVTLINIGLGVVVGLAMWMLGMPNAALWGAMATMLNFIPYLGAMTGTLIVFLVAVFSFDSLTYACLVPAVYFGLTALEGNVVTPSLLGRRMSMSPVVVFLSLVFWGWMWGVGGVLIAVPTLAILKVGCDEFERTKPLGTLLGG